MASDDDLRNLFERTGRLESRVDVHEIRLDNVTLQMGEHRSENRSGFKSIDNAIREMSKKIENLTIENAKNTSAGVSRREVFSWLIAVAGVAFSLSTLLVK